MILMQLLVTDTFEQTEHFSFKLLGLLEDSFIYPDSILTYLLLHPDRRLPSTLLALSFTFYQNITTPFLASLHPPCFAQSRMAAFGCLVCWQGCAPTLQGMYKCF